MQHVFIFDVLGQVRADAHREKIKPDDGGKLQNTVAQKIACECGDDELVSEAAAGDDENRDNEGAVGIHDDVFVA